MKQFVFGKNLVFGFGAVLLLTFGPVRVACAQRWWQHTGPGPMGAGADKRFYFYSKWTRPRFRKAQLEKPTLLYTSPKSVGWCYKTPGPMGAGSGNP